MNKVLLIIQREYLSRVKKKSFILMTILVPVLFIGMIGLIAFITAKQGDFGDKKKVIVVDESANFLNKLKGSDNLEYVYTTDNYAATKGSFIKNGYDYFLYIPASLTGVQLLGEKKASIMTNAKVRMS